jgi:lysophospholipase L1-like esterase
MPSPYIAPQVITLDDLKLGNEGQIPDPGDSRFAYRILAEGDSWFSIGAVPSSNLLFELGLSDTSIVVNIAYPGDTVEAMSSLAGNPDLRKMIYDDQWAYEWDVILLSGGGNDIIDRARDFIVKAPKKTSKKPADWVDVDLLAELVSDVQDCYRKVVEIRDEPGSANADVPILVHTYDYLTPRNAPAKFGFAGITGPWFYPRLEAVGAPANVHVPIARYVMDRLAEGLLALSQGPGRLPNVHVVDTRKTLDLADPDDMGNSNDWLNEIHPNHPGYRKLARKISAKLQKVLNDAE